MLTRVSALALLCLLGTAPQRAPRLVGPFRLHVPAASYFAGSRVHITTEGVSGRYTLSLLGPGSIDGDTFVAPQLNRGAWTTIVGASSAAVAYAAVRTVPPPAASHLVAVATYRGGIALHDERTFANLGNFAIAGAPADVAFLPNGSFVTSDTDGTILTRVDRNPWTIANISGVEAGNEIAVDDAGNVFVSDRDVQGQGALTRVTPGGAVSRVITGVTAEGIALDNRLHLAYVSNVNDHSVAEVDTQTMRVLRKIAAPERPFGIALDERTRRLYVVSNVSPSMTPGGGFVAAIALGRPSAPTVARSPHLKFPLGAAFDARTNRLFVTDEAADVVYVLNGTTLRPVRAPLQTCSTPWRPRVSGGRLYVPCAREDRVDVFSIASLTRVRGAPFPTSGYPLSVATWH